MCKLKQGILLTGSHRSGTTWAGRVIASARDVGYIMEPFNDVNRRPGIFKPQFGRFFPYLNDEEKINFQKDFQNTLNFRYSIKQGLLGAATAREYARVGYDAVYSGYDRVRGYRAFVKDPNALFMAEWLASTFDMRVVVMIRHPAAFISSLMMLNWSFPFGDYLQQPNLMENYLSEYREEIEYYSQKEQPLIDQAILAWKTLHHVISEYKKHHQDWLFVRHEDLSRDPHAGFRRIYHELDLSFDEKVQTLVQTYSGSSNPKDMTSKDIPVSSSKSIKRDSSSNIFNWKNRLSVDEIAYIRDRVEPVSSIFYAECDW